jgi:phosphate transporter
MSSGLLKVLDDIIRHLVEGYKLYHVVLILSPIVLVRNCASDFPLLRYVIYADIYSVSPQVISTFISHTIASVLLVPIAKAVGDNLPGEHANLLIFITGLICSCGMGMPVSGFPNQTA